MTESNKLLYSNFNCRSEEKTYYPSEVDGGDTDVVFVVVISVVSVFFVILIVTCLSYRCMMRARRYKNVPDYETGEYDFVNFFS